MTYLDLRHLPLCLPFNSQEELEFMWGHKGHSLTWPASTSRPSDSMDVDAWAVWDLVVDNKLNLWQEEMFSLLLLSMLSLSINFIFFLSSHDFFDLQCYHSFTFICIRKIITKLLISFSLGHKTLYHNYDIRRLDFKLKNNPQITRRKQN